MINNNRRYSIRVMNKFFLQFINLEIAKYSSLYFNLTRDVQLIEELNTQNFFEQIKFQIFVSGKEVLNRIQFYKLIFGK